MIPTTRTLQTILLATAKIRNNSIYSISSHSLTAPTTAIHYPVLLAGLFGPYISWGFIILFAFVITITI